MVPTGAPLLIGCHPENAYTDFGTIGRAALEMTAQRHGVELGDHDRGQIFGAMRYLPAHPDVQPGLERLRDAGFRLAALTNSMEEVARIQLAHAGLAGYVEQILSVDAVRRFKPAPEVYRMEATRLQVPTQNMRLIAAHGWDVAGAQRAGCPAAFAARPGKVLDPLAPRPDVVGADIPAIADQIVAIEANTGQ